jgi:hypothetical protein
MIYTQKRHFGTDSDKYTIIKKDTPPIELSYQFKNKELFLKYEFIIKNEMTKDRLKVENRFPYFNSGWHVHWSLVFDLKKNVSEGHIFYDLWDAFDDLQDVRIYAGFLSGVASQLAYGDTQPFIKSDKPYHERLGGWDLFPISFCESEIAAFASECFALSTYFKLISSIRYKNISLLIFGGASFGEVPQP